jgi:hypothetical protein
MQASVRKTHNSGKKHKDNVRAYYQEWYDKNYQKLVESGMSGMRAPFSVSSFVTCTTIVEAGICAPKLTNHGTFLARRPADPRAGLCRHSSSGRRAGLDSRAWLYGRWPA